MVQQHLQAGDYSSVVITPTGVQSAAQTTFRRRRYVPPVRDSGARFMRIGRPGSKRYQRFINKEYLTEQQWDLELEDFQVVRFGGTPFTPLFEEHNSRIWAPFVDVTEEEEQWLIRQLCEGKSLEERSDELGDWIMVEEEDLLVDDFVEQVVHASTSILRIQKNIRQYVRQNPDFPFLNEMDKAITDYIENGSGSLTYSFETSFHRMICHGICQYYSLHSRSEDSEDGIRVMVISKPRKGISLPSHRLTEYLQTLSVST